jgi:trehalose synthase
MRPVDLTERRIDSYRPGAGNEAIDELRRIAEPLRGLRVLHVNSTPRGGGVAEILQSSVPLLRDLGLQADWWTMDCTQAFFTCTKLMHDRLQGADGRMTSAEREQWLDGQRSNAEALPGGYDVVVVHDPQPAGLSVFAQNAAAHWIWRLHIDSSHPHPGVWSFLRPFLDPYEALIFTLPEYVPPEVPPERLRFMAPAIDPLLPKNRPIPIGTARQAVARLGIDLARPLVAQVARLDPWKDPDGVIDAYGLVKQHHPGLQLALLGAMEADDDPEAEEIAAATRAHAGDDPDIHIYTDPEQIGPLQVGSVQVLADVVFQKSLREGFGLSVAEAMWKATPVIGGRAGGIPLQLQDEAGGFLVDSPEEAAERCDWLLANPAEGRAIGAAGRAVVRSRFLVTRLLAEELALYADVVDVAGSATRAGSLAAAAL